MPGPLNILQFSRIFNGEWESVLQSLEPSPSRDSALLANGSGANVVLCTEQGFKVSMHEVVVNRCTNILDAFDSSAIEELRDPFGRLLIVLQDVKQETLNALSQLLYTGECFIESDESHENLTDLLASSVTKAMEIPIKKEVNTIRLPTITATFSLNQNTATSISKPDDMTEDEHDWDNFVSQNFKSSKEQRGKDFKNTDEEGSDDFGGNGKNPSSSIENDKGDSKTASSEADDRNISTKNIHDGSTSKSRNLKAVHNKPKNKLAQKKYKKKPEMSICEVCDKSFEDKSKLKVKMKHKNPQPKKKNKPKKQL